MGVREVSNEKERASAVTALVLVWQSLFSLFQFQPSNSKALLTPELCRIQYSLSHDQIARKLLSLIH